MAALTDQELRDIIEMIHGQNMARNVALRALLRERPSTKEVLADFLADVEAGDGLPEDASDIARESFIATLRGLVK